MASAPEAVSESVQSVRWLHPIVASLAGGISVISDDAELTVNVNPGVVLVSRNCVLENSGMVILAHGSWGSRVVGRVIDERESGGG